MNSPLSLTVSLAVVICLSGCGGGSLSTSAGGNVGGSVTPTFTGNWYIGTGALPFEGFLSQNGSSVSGTIRGSGCTTFQFVSIPVNGLLNNGQLTLAGSTVYPTTENFSLNATVSANLTSFQGQITYNSPLCGTFQTFTATGQQIGLFSGSWAGTVLSASGSVAGIAVVITEGAPDANGFPVLTGSVTISNTPCFTTGSITGNQFGPYLNVIASTTNGLIYIPNQASGDALSAALSNPTNNNQLAITYSVGGGTCNGDYGTGTLNRSQ